VTVIAREGWGARPPACETPLPLPQVQGFAVHYSGTGADFGRNARLVMRAHQDFHLDTRGWCDIAYSFEISMRTGEVLEGRGWSLRSAAQGTNEGNDAFLAICFQGADKKGRKDLSTPAVESFVDLCREFRMRKGRWPVVKPHSHFTGTECPGDEIRAMLALEPWKVSGTERPWPRKLPPWWWRWNAWRLGEGAFRADGKRNRAARYRTGAPKLIPPWAHARARAFDRARRES
jgi:hypothetical protein